jgi:hypothetical protein
MVATAESAQEHGLSAGKSRITASHDEAADVRRKNKSRPHAGTQFLGVRPRPSGLYGAQIWDPLRRINVWLGSFRTAQDAAKAYDAAAAELQAADGPVKKTAATELQAVERVLKKMTPAAELQAVERAVKKETAARPGGAWTEFHGVRRQPSGNYKATIWHPSRRAQACLGTFVTAENAAGAYDAAAVKLHGEAARTNFGVDDGVDVKAVRVPRRARGRSGFRGVRQQQGGKYCARIRDPVRRARLHLGMFVKAEDAARAYDAEAVRLRGNRAITNFKQPPPMGLSDFPELPAAARPDAWTEFRGVYRTVNGKYAAQVRHSKTRSWLGTFDAAEDAARAYDAEAVKLHGARAVTNFKQPSEDDDTTAETMAVKKEEPSMDMDKDTTAETMAVKKEQSSMYMDLLNDFSEMPAVDFLSHSFISGAQLDDLWAGLPPAEQQLDVLWAGLPPAERHLVDDFFKDVVFSDAAP